MEKIVISNYNLNAVKYKNSFFVGIKKKRYIKTENEVIITDYSLSGIIKNNFMTQQYQLYALSKLRYKNHNTLCRFLLLLSGDIESNPGPEDSCAVCNRKMAVRHKFCVAGSAKLGYIKNAQVYRSLVINQ